MTMNWKMNHHKQEHKSLKIQGPHHQQAIQVIKALQVQQLMLTPSSIQ